MTLSAEDKLEIQMLSSRYAMAMDEGDQEQWIDTWSEDGIWEGGIGRYAGLEKLRRLLADLGDRIKGKRHLMTNFVIDGDSDSARQKCYLMVVEIGEQPRLVSTLFYQDQLRKIAGQWKFVHRQVALDKRVAVS